MDLHSGFDEQGRVEDLAETWETINAIEPYLPMARGNIVKAVVVVYEALRAYQIDKKYKYN